MSGGRDGKELCRPCQWAGKPKPHLESSCGALFSGPNHLKDHLTTCTAALFTLTSFELSSAELCNQIRFIPSTTTMATNGNVITAATPDISKREKFGLLFGYPIAHSYSPLMHQTVYDNIGYNWQQFLFESTDMSQFLEIRQHPQFYGQSSTNCSEEINY